VSRVLLVNPPSAIGVYDDSKIRVAITSAPFVTLASLAGAILEEGHEVMISDLMVETNPPESYRSILESFSPNTTEVWEHENLDWDTIRRYYARFHRKFYFRPGYIWRRFWRDLRMGQLMDDVKAVLANDWSG
jgi:hypothetical protein